MIEKDSNIYFEILKEKNRKTMLPDSLAFLSRFAYNVKSKIKKKKTSGSQTFRQAKHLVFTAKFT